MSTPVAATYALLTDGVAGVVVQSGGMGIALLEQMSRLGIGVSSFASVGDKYDVSTDDLLTWWAQDEVTRIAILYVESFGNPRKFAGMARRVAQRMPVLTVIGGRSPAGQRAAASHHAAAATPLATQEALFGQAGVIATTSLGELVDTAALLACQPLPAGNRVAIVSNAGGAGVLARQRQLPGRRRRRSSTWRRLPSPECLPTPTRRARPVRSATRPAIRPGAGGSAARSPS